MQLRHVRPEHLHVIADLSHRANRRASRPDGVTLLDGNGGRNVLNTVHLGLVHAVEKLPRVRREGLDISPLALGKERIERQRTLTRSTQARDGHKPVERQVQIEIL